MSNIKFDEPKKVANEMTNIIAPLFGVSKLVKIGIDYQISLKSDEEVRKYLISVLKYLAEEYKK